VVAPVAGEGNAHDLVERLGRGRVVKRALVTYSPPLQSAPEVMTSKRESVMTSTAVPRERSRARSITAIWFEKFWRTKRV
jgi:hypothetical protein